MANERRKSSAVRVGNWMWTLLLASIPVVNIIFFIITAFATRKASKRSWAIANLIWLVISVALIACTVIFFGQNLLNGVLYLGMTPVSELSASGFFSAILHP